MNILIVGCGRAGRDLAIKLQQNGHDVSVIDRNQTNLDELRLSFSGLTFCGIPIDTDILRAAGIAECDAVCTVSEDGNTNIMVSELAKEIFKIPLVLTRVFDSSNVKIFEEMGLRTICSTTRTVDAFFSAIEQYDDVQYVRMGTHSYKFFTMETPKEYIGEKISEIGFEENEELFAIIGADGALRRVHDYSEPLLEGDRLIFAKLI